MDTWLTYSPQDFLLFSERVYWRLFELHNAAFWPAQVPALLAGLAVPTLLLRRPAWAGRAAAAILALAWAVAGLGFLTRYATINWMAGDLVPVFLGQAVLVAALGFTARALRPASAGAGRWIGLGLCLYGLAVPALAGLALGRGAASTEIFALTPDPTAIVTLGAVLAAERRWPALLLGIIPVAWCLASWATLATLGVTQAWIFAPVALAIAAAGVRGMREQGHARGRS